MEIEARKGVVGKKLWKMVRVLFFMIRKGIAKTKTMININLILKRGKHAGKGFINTVMMNRRICYSSFTCCSGYNNGNSFTSPLEFEFSCSNTPFHHSSRSYYKPRRRYKDVFIMNNNNKTNNEMAMNNEKEEAVKNSSLHTLAGFEKDHVGRQIRVSDSPFPVKDEGESYQVDMAAEEFINNFYKQLIRQNKSIATYESP